MSDRDPLARSTSELAADAGSDLDNPILSAPQTEHRPAALAAGRALAYPPSFGAFAALTEDTQAAWDDLRSLRTGAAQVVRQRMFTPHGWTLARRTPLLQMIATGVHGGRTDVAVVRLDVPDSAQMVALASSCRVDAFEPDLVRLSSHYGVFHDGQLVAMAGTRFATAYWREISTVVTDPLHRGRGLAGALVGAARREIEASGRWAYLHVEEDSPALDLGRRLGFTPRRRLVADLLVPQR